MTETIKSGENNSLSNFRSEESTTVSRSDKQQIPHPCLHPLDLSEVAGKLNLEWKMPNIRYSVFKIKQLRPVIPDLSPTRENPLAHRHLENEWEFPYQDWVMGSQRNVKKLNRIKGKTTIGEQNHGFNPIFHHFFEQSFEELSHLEYLNIAGRWNNEDPNFHVLGEEISRYLHNLRHLRLEFTCFSEMGKAFKKFFHNLSRLRRPLESLEVVLPNVTSKGAGEILTHIRRCFPELKRLCLEFKDSLGEDGIPIILSKLDQRFRKLEHLGLTFRHNTHITKKELDLTKYAIIDGKLSLKHIELTSEFCPNVFEDQLDLFESELKNKKRDLKIRISHAKEKAESALWYLG